MKSNWLKAAYYKKSIELILIMYIVLWKINIKSYQKCCPYYIMRKALLHFPNVFVVFLFLFVLVGTFNNKLVCQFEKGEFLTCVSPSWFCTSTRDALWGWLVLDFVLGHPLVALILTVLAWVRHRHRWVCLNPPVSTGWYLLHWNAMLLWYYHPGGFCWDGHLLVCLYLRILPGLQNYLMRWCCHQGWSHLQGQVSLNRHRELQVKIILENIN